MKTKNIGKISATSAVLFLLFFPAFGFIHALDLPGVDTPKDYTLLAPLPNISPNCPDGSTPTLVVKQADGSITGGCQTTLSQYLPAAFNLIIGLCAVLAFLVLTYGGVLYMTSDAISGKSSGKEYITNALWGLGLAIASWVILYTINPAILHFNLQLVQPPNINMQAGDILSAIAASSAAGTPLAGQPMTAAQISANAQIATQLGQTSNPCVQGQGQTSNSCVNLVGLQSDTVTGLQNLKVICANYNSDSCPNFTITNGTNGFSDPNGCHPKGTCVDVSPTQDLKNTITNNFTLTSGTAGASCSVYTDGAGDTYLYEITGSTCGGPVASSGNHWHITFK
jgi:hypothetical protein